MHSIEDLPTPCLLLDPIRMQRNMLPDLPVGALVRLLPNHACATAAQHDRYHLLSDDGKRITAVWPRFGGW